MLTLLCVLAAPASGCSAPASAEGSERHAAQTGVPKSARAPARIEVAKRAGKVKQHPCNECHDKIEPTVDSGPLTLPLKGTHRSMTLDHFAGAADCYLCHNKGEMNSLRLLTGEQLSYDDSHRLCGQCHGERLRDWSIGAHGKHVGSWQGVRHRSTCVDCHNPHLPARPRVKALPAPPFPERGIPKGRH